MGTPSGKIVVGIDGTDESLAALRWALEEGGRAGVTVEVVHAWSLHSLRDKAFGTPRELENGSRCMLQNEVRAAQAATSVPPPAVLQTSRRGSPAAVLCECVTGASLLVLGAHGSTGLRSKVLGRVLDAVIHHIVCPVVTVDRTGTTVSHSSPRSAVSPV